MNHQDRIFLGCIATAISEKTYLEFVKMLSTNNLEHLIHPKDVQFMNDACELYVNRKATKTLHELGSMLQNHTDIAD